MPVKTPVYLDYNATTPIDPRVLGAMMPYLTGTFGNPSSSHAFGCAAAQAVERARGQVAALIGADPREVVFTCGATESNNLAIKGVARNYADKGRHIVTAAHEHKAVIDPCKTLMQQGYDVTWLRPSPGSGGVIHADQVAQAIRNDTILVSIMWANNEVGTINDVPGIGAVCKERGVIFHSDATQYVGKQPIDVNAAGLDLMSASAHKFYGPKGVGFLYVRRKGPRVRLTPIMEGGGHERGMRSGTLNAPGIVGLGATAEFSAADMQADAARLRPLRDRLEAAILAGVEGAIVNGDRTRRMPHVTNISLPEVRSDRIMKAMPDVAISSGSACSSASVEPSYVLRAIGVPDELSPGSVRFSLGRPTTEAEVDYAIERLLAAYAQVRDAGADCEMGAERAER
jgi:cysteine desulfurase